VGRKAIRSKAGGPEVEAREGEHAHACGRVTDMADKILCKQGCGRELTSEGRRVQHELRCDGKPIATSGRIAANGGVPARSEKNKRATHRPGGAARRLKAKGNGHIGRTPPEPVALTPAAILVALRAEQVKLQTAIAAIEALG
jgi:hypothetical protein